MATPADRRATVRTLLGSVLVVGFLLGAANSGVGSPLMSGLVWAGGSVLGGVVGLMVFLGFAEIAVSSSREEDKIGTDAGAKLLLFFVVLGAVAMWAYLFNATS